MVRRLYIPFTPRALGGPSVFARKLADGLPEFGWEVEWKEPSQADAALVVVSAPLPVLLGLALRRIPWALRLDGVATPASSPRWRRKNLLPWLAFRGATGVIFQSQYSRFLVERFLGSIGSRPHSIVYNGVDLDRFHPDGEGEASLGRGDLFTAGVFRHLQQLGPMVEALARVRRQRPDCRLFVAGEVTPPLRPWLERDGVQFVGSLDNSLLPRWERAAGAFVFSTLNPPCPNAVIEAMACGCPVVGYRTGSMAELLGEEGALAEHSDEGLEKFVPGDPDPLAKKILAVLEGGEPLREKARLRAESRFSLSEMCRRYALFFDALIPHRPSSGPGTPP